jgi:exopolyphosphatase/guanosine-5'-triphosphate,3'-diphosphate pyrophosphatase
VVDIGGGSTEFIVGTPGLDPDGAVSVDLGCVRLTEQFLSHDPPRAEELSEALSAVRDALEDVARDLPSAADAGRFVGLAGTVTTAAALEIGLATYDRDRLHHFELSHDAVEDVFRSMAMGDRDERLGHPGLEPARADVIVGGLCVLVSIFRFFAFESCLVSESDLLDGLAAQILRTAATR